MPNPAAQVYHGDAAMPNKRIIIRLIGSDTDGDVRLLDFTEELEAFSEALRQTERLLSGRDKPSIYYKIVDLRHGSPATVVIEAVRGRNAPVSPSKVMHTFVRDLRLLRKKKTPAKVDLPMLEAYRDLALPLQRHMRVVEVVEIPEQRVILIDSLFTQHVEEVIGPDLVSYGSISGRLERVNLHNALRFEIYPPVGPRRVKCEFRSDQKKRVKDALDNYVTVSGRLRYKKWDKYPHAIDVRPG